MVPARSGSKGLPNKNIRHICGEPLLNFSVLAGQACRLIDEVYVNSDSREYLRLAAKYGAEPYLRRPELASDHTTMKDVVVNFANSPTIRNLKIDAIAVLYPTYPTRTAVDIGNYLQFFLDNGGDKSVIGFIKPRTHPFMCYTLDKDAKPSQALFFDVDQHYRRQDYPEYWEFTAWACVIPICALDTINAQMMNSRTIGYKIPKSCNVIDIDTLEDFEKAEKLLSVSMPHLAEPLSN